MLPAEQFPIISYKQQLEQAGFSSDEADHLLMLKAGYDQRVYDEVGPEHKQLEFARWLYTHGYLKS